MKQFRFGLDDRHLDADLCSKIEEIANGGSLNDAARFYFRHLHLQSKGQKVTPERQADDNIGTDSDNEDSINLSGLKQLFNEQE